MKSYVFSRLALRDLQEIWDYIAQDNVSAADRVIRKLRDEIRVLTGMPGKGHQRQDVDRDDLRFWRVYSYLIVYRIDTDPLQVARIIHGARDIPDILLEY
jgi:plasmid stabilization system protein ParE